MDLMHAEPVTKGSVWAVGFLSLVLVLGGLPLASVGLTLSALTSRRGITWPSWWFRVFQLGFAIQTCSVVVTILLSFVVRPFSPPPLPRGTVWESMLPAIFVGTAVGGGFALRAWRELIASVRVEAPPSIVR
jgi:hypothetical protein